jgi:endo-1,4-beta-xylanase
LRCRGLPVHGKIAYARHDYDEKYNPWKDGVLPKDVEKEHARRYIDLFKMYLRHADVIDRVTLWGLTDGDSWLNDFPVRGRTDYPLFFGRDGQMKLCAKAVWRLAQQTAEKKSKNGK